jgi:putative transposase
VYIKRNRTPSEYICYGLYLYFSGLSLRRTSERLSSGFIKRNHVSIWNWIQKYNPKKITAKRKKIEEFIVDETLIRVGSEFIWLWVAIESKNKQILGLSISKERNMFVAERFISRLIKIHGKHNISTDGDKWYPQACKFLKIDHHPHSSYEKSIIERTMQYLKDRTEGFDDYFQCRRTNCKLKHVKKWLKLFIDYHNKELKA